MKRLLSFLGLSVLFFGSALSPIPALAFDCYVDPVLQYSGSGRIASAVYLRSEACTTGTMILKTLSAGTSVDVVGYTDGWYEVVAGGKRGWIGQQFLTASAQATGVSWSSYEEYRSNPPNDLTAVDLGLGALTETAYTGAIASRNLIKLVCPSDAAADDPCKAVYYVGTDGKRHAFPNSKVYFTWYANFDAVKAVTLDRLGAYALGANVTYRPGDRMVKFTTDPKVYAVSEGGVLRWVKTEELARGYYGMSWNTKIDDIPDAFYTNYTFGAEIASSSDYQPTAELEAASTID